MTTIQNVSLILEGGTFRTIYTAGILDAMMEEDLYFPYIAAISAGSINAVSYASKQPKRTFDVLTKYRNDPRYMGFRNFWKEKSYFGLDFSYNIIPNQLNLFDWDTYYQYDGEIEIGVTNAITGEIEYLNGLTMGKDCMMIRASCAIPLVFPEMKIDEIPYYDGGLANAIPIDRAIEKGYDKHVLVLTRPPSYVKTAGKGNKMMVRLLKKKYPNLVKQLQTRAARYNDTMKEIHQLEQEGKVFIFKPEYALKSFEGKVDIMQRNYDMGYRHAKERMAELKTFINYEVKE